MAERGRDPRLRPYEVLVGDWEVVLPPSRHLNHEVRGATGYEWLSGGRFLIQRSTSPDPFPDGISIIGSDGDESSLAMHYFDSRGVSRLYRTSFEGGVLRTWRDAAGPEDFAQRYAGNLSEDGSEIEGSYYIREPGEDWKEDFPVRYRRRG